MASLQLYTDGAAKGNPGPGGYGIVLIWGAHTKEISEGFRYTTNNRMELLAVIRGLQALKGEGHQVDVYSDSKYVVDAVEKGWLQNWLKTGFKGKKNPDLWQEYVRVSKVHKVRFHWVKGHADNPMNNRCDALAVAASEGKSLNIDHYFENESGRS